MNHRLLTDLYAERDKLNTVIEYLEKRFGGARRAKAIRDVDVALDMAATNGRPKKYKRRSISSNNPHSLFRGTVDGKKRAVEEIAVPSGLDIANLPITDAIALAVKAVRKPLPTPELANLLQRAGVRIKNKPVYRYVGLVASALVKAGKLQKTPDGWTGV